MVKNRFERVSEVQPDAITLCLSRCANGEVGSVIFPASASGGKFAQDKISGELPALDSFRSAVKLANEMKVAIVVMDPDVNTIEANSTHRSRTNAMMVSRHRGRAR